MARGKALIQYAECDDLDGFQKVFATVVEERALRNMMFWHVQRAFKIAIRNKSLLVIEHIVEDLDLDLTHECFKELFHMFLFTCPMAEQLKDEDMQEVNRQVVRYLTRAARGGIDFMDSNGSTALQIACDLLTDIVIIETIMGAGADINCVNNDNEMPLKTIKARLAKDPDNEGLQDIEELLERKGGMTDWRTW